MRARTSIFVLALTALGCESAIEGPSPVISPPDGGVTALTPGYVCREQLTTEVVLSGSGFAPTPIDVPGAPRTALPTVTLTGNIGVAGTPIEAPSPLVFGGELRAPNAAKLTWQSQQQMTFTIDQEMVIGESEPGLLPAAVYDVQVTNYPGEIVLEGEQLALIDRPSVTSFAPTITCLAQGDRALRFDGASFAVLDGQEAVVDIGEASGFVVGAFDGCVDVPHAVVPGRLCGGADVPLAEEALPPGYHRVIVANPTPAACRSEDDLKLRVVPAPTLTEAEPALACVAEGPRDVVLRGADLLEIDGVLPAVTMTDATGAVVPVEVTTLQGTCEPLEVQGHTVQRCTEALVVIAPERTHDAPYLPTFALTNPGPAGCEAVLPEAFVIVPPPTLAEAEPAAICTAEGDRDVILHGTGYIEVNGEAPAVVFGELDLEVLELADCEALPVPRSTVRRCETMTVRVPMGSPMLADGAFVQPDLRITNPAPAGCGVTSEDALTVLPAPTVATAEPPLVCDAQGAREVRLLGSGFVEYDGVPPAVTFAGSPVTVIGFEDCVDVPVPGVVVRTCAAMTVTVAQETFEFAAEADSLVAAIALTNPAPVGCGAQNEGALVAVPAPSIAALEPPMLCSGSPVTLTVLGDHFLTVDGMPPVVTLDDVALDPGAIVAEDCTDIEVDRLTVTSCERLVLTVDPAVIAGGQAVVAVANPNPAGCGDVHGQPVAVVAPPRVDEITPDFLCTDDGGRALVLTGADFLRIGDALPTVTFGDAEVLSTLAEDCQEMAVGALSWATCGTLRVSVAQGALAPGRPMVRVQNPAPAHCAADFEGQLTVPPTLTLIEVDPTSVCVEAGDRELLIEGTGFLEIDGQPPELTIAGAPFGIEALEGCVPVPGRPEARACTSLRVTLPQGTVPQGAVEIAVRNAGEAQCGTLSADLFYVVPVPVIDRIEPAVVCERASETFEIIGRDFTPVSEAFLNDRPAPTEFIDANTLVVTVEDAVDPGAYDLMVRNADGCEATAPAAVQVAPSPVVFFVDPPVDYNGITLQATVFASRLDAAPDEVLIDGPGDAMVLAAQPRDGRPNQIRVVLPAGIEPGLWNVQITSALGCVGRLEGGLTVTDDLSIGIASVTPPFAAPDAPTAVVIAHGAGTGFAATPRAYLTPSVPEPGVAASPMRAVVFVDGDRLTAVVPAGLAPRAYDLIVVNPDASVGLLEQAVTVVPNEPPVVAEVVPASLNGNGPQEATLRGRGFGAEPVTVSLRCRTPMGVESESAGAVIANSQSPDEVRVSLPAGDFDAGSVCLVRLVRGDGAFFDYSAVSIKTPAQNLNPWSPSSAMTTPRRALGLVAGRPTEASRFLYAVGGDAGSDAQAMDSVEAAQVDLYGGVGAWRIERHALPAPRTRAGVIRVGDFVYVIGGHDGDAPVDTVYRARVLDPLATPEVHDLAMFLDEEADDGLGAGVWHYRVSAVMGADDASDPNGEGLPGEVMVVQLPAAVGLHLQLSWTPIPEAVGYRIYRTAEAGDGVDTVRLVAETDATTWLDRGVAVGDAVPLPSGSLGGWHAVAALGSARAGVAVAMAPAANGDVFVYAFGGQDANGPLASYTFARIAPDADGVDALGAWQAGDQPLGTARYDGGTWTVDENSGGAVPLGETWIYFGPGRTAGGFTRVVEAARVGAQGMLEAWIEVDSATEAAGYGAGSANGFLFFLGSRDGQPDDFGISAELCGGNGRPCNGGPPDPPDLRNWNNLGVSLGTARAYLGMAQESAFFFIAGGLGNNGVLSSVEQTVQ